MKGLIFAILTFFAALPCAAQVQLIPSVKTQWFDNNGRVLAGGCVFSYQSGTTTPQATFTDSTGGTPNPNPVVLNAAGRPVNDIWLTGITAYRIKLVSAGGVNCASGVTLWQEDGINPSPASLLASNNTWTGSNTFNGAVTFNSQPSFTVGLTSTGPNVLNGGGTIAGTWTGSPVFSGVPNFSSGLITAGQITSTVSTGTAPFVIASTTKVPNLNVDLLDGCDWAIPCPIGTTTPNTAIFTTLKIGGSPVLTAVDGAGTHLAASSSSAPAAGQTACYDANGNVTNSGCVAAVQAASITTLGADIILTAATTSTVLTKLVTMPASGCPCRAFVSTSVYLETDTSTVFNTVVNDGTDSFATGQMGSGANGTYGMSTSSFSTGTYVNGANITFTLTVRPNVGTVLKVKALANTGIAGAQNTWMNVVIFPSL